MALVIPGRLIFVHVPKTGGTWIKKVLRPQIGGAIYTRTSHGNPWAAAGHPDLRDLEGIEGYRCAFVRHPVDWWLSFWRHRQRRGGSWDMSLELDRAVRAKTIKRYVHHILERMPGFVSMMFAQYAGVPGHEIDFVGRLERFDADIRIALTRAGFDVDALDLTAAPKNVGAVGHEFTPRQRRAIAEAERAGIERFGYDPC
jgi:hypothetical protein